jgi:hypothetical protein
MNSRRRIDAGELADRGRVPSVFGEESTWKAWIDFRSLSLNFGLQRRSRVIYCLRSEDKNDYGREEI